MARVVGHLRPRTFFEILDGALRHYRSRFKRMLVPFLPLACVDVLAALLNTFMQQLAFSMDEGSPEPDAAFAGVFGLIFIVSFVRIAAYLLGYGATVYLAASDLQEKKMTPRQAWMMSGSRFWAFTGLAIIVSTIASFGFLVFIIPGIYLAIRFLVTPQVLFLEGANAFDTLGRSAKLVEGKYWRGFGILIVLMILSSVFSATLMGFQVSSVFFLDEEGEIGDRTAFFLTLAFGQLFAALVGLLLAPLTSLMFTHFYWDLRVRKEGLDLEQKLRRREEPVAA